jgi:A/G-specific adenine glycosylase
MVGDAYSKGLKPSHLNQAWMELGATICTPKNPKCELCPISKGCAAFKTGTVLKYPEKKKRAAKVRVEERRHAWLITGKSPQILFSRIPEGQWRAGLWDLPPQAPKKGKRIGRVESKHIVTNHEIIRTTEVWELQKSSTRVTGKWDSFHSPKLPLGSAPKKVLQLIRERFFS